MKHLPNLFTLLNLVFGCLAIVCILQNGITIVYSAEGTQYVDIPEKMWMAALFMALAAVADFIDGFVARLFKANSAIGKELDSLADVVSFGVAPGLIIYQFLRMSFMRQPDGADVSMLWLVPAFLIPCAAASRLARFNLDTTQTTYFKGIPVPAVGLLIGSFPLIYWMVNTKTALEGDLYHWAVLALLNKWVLYAIILGVSLGMVSRIPMIAFKFKSLSLQANLPIYLLLAIGVIAFLFLHWLAVPVIFILYIVLSLAFKKRIV